MRGYFAGITALLFVLPVTSAYAEWLAKAGTKSPAKYLARWFVFWPLLRLCLAGVVQMRSPQVTLDTLKNSAVGATPVVHELGMAKVAMGSLGISSLFFKDYTAPAAQVGALYYMQAGIGHFMRHDKNAEAKFAAWTDVSIAGILALIFVGEVVD